jgi:hypothetical protein
MNSTARVRQVILACGGIRQDEHRDPTLTGQENRRLHAHLDRRNGESMDVVAAILSEVVPESGIQDSDDLADWLSMGSDSRDYLGEYERQREPEPDPIEWQYIDQAERMGRAMRASLDTACGQV